MAYTTDDKLKVLIDLAVENQATLKIILDRINGLEIVNRGWPDREKIKDNKLEGIFPIKTLQGLLSVEETLKEDKQFEVQLVSTDRILKPSLF